MSAKTKIQWINKGLSAAKVKTLSKDKEKVLDLIKQHGGSNYCRIRCSQLLEKSFKCNLIEEEYFELLHLISLAHFLEFNNGGKEIQK